MFAGEPKEKVRYDIRIICLLQIEYIAVSAGFWFLRFEQHFESMRSSRKPIPGTF